MGFPYPPRRPPSHKHVTHTTQEEQQQHMKTTCWLSGRSLGLRFCGWGRGRGHTQKSFRISGFPISSFIPGGIRSPPKFGKKQTQLLPPWQLDSLPSLTGNTREGREGHLRETQEAPSPGSGVAREQSLAWWRGVCPSQSCGVCPDLSLRSPRPQMPPVLESPPLAIPSLRFRALCLRVPAFTGDRPRGAASSPVSGSPAR